MLDVQQTFDKVFHPWQLYKIKRKLRYEFTLLQSYLEDRQFYVMLNGKDWILNIIEAEIPDGSVLKPFFTLSSYLICRNLAV